MADGPVKKSMSEKNQPRNRAVDRGDAWSFRMVATLENDELPKTEVIQCVDFVSAPSRFCVFALRSVFICVHLWLKSKNGKEKVKFR